MTAGSAAAAEPANDPYEHYLKTSGDFARVSLPAAMVAKAWPTFTYMPWPAKWTMGFNAAAGRWAVDQGYNGAVLDREPSKERLAWVDQFNLRFYLDHAAGKGDLHMWDGGAVKAHLKELHGTGVRTVPVNAALMEKLKKLLKRHIGLVKGSPNRAAYALDDELSWGHFVHPTMWRVTDDAAAYPKWLKQIYGDAAAPRGDRWLSYEDVRPSLKTWSVAEFDASPLLDQWTFNDATWCNFLGELVAYANTLDPSTPVGFVGGQAPNAFGGYDYARLMRKVEFIESYNLGSSQAIIRSFNPGNAIPAVTTHFHQKVDDTKWQAWYYLAHGNKGMIGWVQDWFEGDKPKAFHAEIAPTFREVERLAPILNGATWVHDGVALYYSHPSIQLGWVLDSQAHGKTWGARNNDHVLGASHNVRHAWENMLRDANLQYNFISYVDVVQQGVPAEYKTVILPACLCLSDAEARKLRAFVENGGTLIADYLPGVWDQHGKGRATGGALDDVFGVRQDPRLTVAGVFGGKLWAETDQDANFSFKSYEHSLTNKNACVRDASGFNKAVRDAGVGHVNKFGKGTAVLMNLSPQWYNAHRVAGAKAAQSRETFLRHVTGRPRVRLVDPEGKAFGYELCTWRAGDRTICVLVSNPEISGNELGGGNSVGLRGETIPVTIEFAGPVTGVKDERTGAALADGQRFEVKWTMSEATVLSFKTPAGGR